jgi:hypothetical protein
MSGDQTSYIRAKMAERGQATATFMKDGFTKWAESETPAREGQMEKIPAEVQMANTGGAMTLAQVKQYAKSLGRDVGGVRTSTLSVGTKRGGRSVLGIEIPEQVEKYIGYAEKFVELVDKVASRLPAIKEDLTDNVIDNNADPSIGPEDKKVAKELLGILQAATGYITTIKRITDTAKQIAKLVGSGSGIRGGATAVDRLTEMIKTIKKYGEILAKWVSTFSKYKNFIRPMLNLRSLQPEGKILLERIDPLLQLVGGSGGARCCCAPRRRGGQSPLDAAQASLQTIYGRQGVMQPDNEMQPYYGPQSYGVMQPYGPQSYGMVPMDQEISTKQKIAMENKEKRRAEKQAAMEEKEKRQAEALANVQRQNAQSVSDVQRDFFRLKGGRNRYAVEYGRTHPPSAIDLTNRGGATTCGGKKPSARGAIVKKVMRELGLSLPQASKYVKDNNLY